MISSFSLDDTSSIVNISELNPLPDDEVPGQISKLWKEGDVVYSVFWVWHCTFVLYCYDDKFPGIEFISHDNQLGKYHGSFVLARLEILKCENDSVLISNYTIISVMDTIEAFFYPEAKLQLLNGVVESKLKGNNAVIVEIRNPNGLFKVFINSVNPKFVNTDRVLNQDSIMIGDEVSMLVTQVKVNNKVRLAVKDEYSILITRIAPKRLIKCRIRSTKINSLIFHLTTLPVYHPRILSKILKHGSLEEFRRFYFTKDQKIAIDKYLSSIPENKRPIFNTSMELEYFEYLRCTEHLDVHHPLTLSLLSLSNVFHSLTSVTLTNEDELKSLVAILKLLQKYLSQEAFVKLVKNVLHTTILNSRSKNDVYSKDFAMQLLECLYSLPHSDCTNQFLLSLLTSYPTNTYNLLLPSNGSMIIESIFRYFYQNHSKPQVQDFVVCNCDQLCNLSQCLQNHMVNPEVAQNMALVACQLTSNQ